MDNLLLHPQVDSLLSISKNQLMEITRDKFCKNMSPDKLNKDKNKPWVLTIQLV